MTPPQGASSALAPSLLQDGPVAEAPRETLTPAPKPQAVIVPVLVLGACAYFATNSTGCG